MGDLGPAAGVPPPTANGLAQRRSSPADRAAAARDVVTAALPVASFAVIPARMQPLVDETAELAARFAEAGFSLYLVGGIVRDAIIGAPMDDMDLDFTTDATPADTKRIVVGWADSVWTQGERFGTIGFHHHGRAHEVTTHRAEAYTPDSRNPDVVFSTDIEADLSRRDFTINAMALSLPDLQLIDPFGGLDDLLAKRLRTPLDPAISFDDDPLRMLRAARFLARFDLEADPALVEALVARVDRLAIISTERIRDEFDRLMVTDPPGLGRGLWFLVQTGLADQFIPELPGMRVSQDPIHQHKDVLTHTIAVVEKTSNDRIVRLAALFHDIGKPATYKVGGRGVSFHHHEVVGARMTRERMKALKYSKDDIHNVSTLVFLHLRFHTYKMGWTDAAVRRYVRDAGPLLERLNELTRCDCTTRNARRARELARRMDDLEERLAELLAREELAAIRPDLDGNDVITHLGVAPGPVVGRAMKFLTDLRLDEGELGRDEALRRLDRWWAAQPESAG